MQSEESPLAIADRLNRECFCIGTDVDALHRSIEADLRARGLMRPVTETHPHLFSSLPVFVSRDHVMQMQVVIRAIESVVSRPEYRRTVLADAPAIAHPDPGHPGVLMSFDFHLGTHGPKLIEINTNAGGAMLNAALAQVQRACCPEVEALVCGLEDTHSLEDGLIASFLAEWHFVKGDAALERIAIVDSSPTEQYLYPEFLLFQRAFESRGIDTIIADPGELSFHDGALWCGNARIDLVYNRLTDFYFEEPTSAALRAAYETRATIVTPHPHAHALYANKRNLSQFANVDALARWGVDHATVATLTAGIPKTIVVDDTNADQLWNERKRWFFKPAHGFGSRGSYRGEKLTKKVFAAISAGNYVAQELVPPSERLRIEGELPEVLKVDLRNYVYRGTVQLVAARLYQGQTTNFRTPGGGFAPVFYPGSDGDCGLWAAANGTDGTVGTPAGASRPAYRSTT